MRSIMHLKRNTQSYLLSKILKSCSFIILSLTAVDVMNKRLCSHQILLWLCKCYYSHQKKKKKAEKSLNFQIFELFRVFGCFEQELFICLWLFICPYMQILRCKKTHQLSKVQIAIKYNFLYISSWSRLSPGSLGTNAAIKKRGW